jgi:hypothetical protein
MKNASEVKAITTARSAWFLNSKLNNIMQAPKTGFKQKKFNCSIL